MKHPSAQLTDLLQHNSVSPRDVGLLRRVASGLDLLADVSHSDLLLYVKSGDAALILAQAQPTSVSPIYQDSMVGQAASRHSDPTIHKALFHSKMLHAARGHIIRGAPTIQDTYPVHNAQGELIAVLSSEMNILEYERRRKKSPILRHAITRLHYHILRGGLQGPDQLSRIGENSATMVIDTDARILYISSLAEQLYRKLGYTTNLLGRRLSELDTNEHVCFKAMERELCLQHKIEEHNLVWIKWVVPLPAEPPHTLLDRLLRRERQVGIALVMIQDITEEYRKEQVLRVKSALIREIHHRVKNNLQTIAALLRMQARRTGSAEVLDMLKQSINRILSIALVHEFLSRSGPSEDDTSLISIKEVTQRIVSEVTQGILDPIKSIHISLEGIDIWLPPQQATSCALVVNELLQNAVEHGFETKNEGTIKLFLREEADQAVIEVVDTGQGLPLQFDIDRDGSLGLQIVQTLVREDLKGSFTLRDTDGVSARVSFPRPSLAEP